MEKQAQGNRLPLHQLPQALQRLPRVLKKKLLFLLERRDYHLSEINPSPSAETIRFRADGGDLPTCRAGNAVQERKQSGYTNSQRAYTHSVMEVGGKGGGRTG